MMAVDIAIAGSLLAIALFVLAVVLLVAMPLFCICDAASRSSTSFEAADSNKTLWIVLPFIFGLLAAVVYLGVVRPKLKAGTVNQ